MGNQRAGSARSWRSPARREHSAPCVPEGAAQLGRPSARELEGAPVPPVPGGRGPQRGSGVRTCRPPHPGPPQRVLREPDTWRRNRPQGTAWVPALAWPPPLSQHAGLPGQGRGGRAPGRVPHTWPGRGASLRASNPGFGASGCKGGVGGSGFPAFLGITPLPNRHLRDRWRRRRASRGAWPRVDWLLGSARGRGRVVST